MTCSAKKLTTYFILHPSEKICCFVVQDVSVIVTDTSMETASGAVESFLTNKMVIDDVRDRKLHLWEYHAPMQKHLRMLVAFCGFGGKDMLCLCISYPTLIRYFVILIE